MSDGNLRIPITPRQADWLADLAASGSESYCAALAAGAYIGALPHGGDVLVVPPAAAYQLGLAIGIRADLADEGELSIGERSSILGLSRKLAANGITNAAPLVVTDPP
jgi:hypothetical protein